MCKYCEEDWTMTPRVADVALLPGLRGEGSRGGVMTTVEERREVAARLRDIGVKTWHTSWHELYAINNACGCYTGRAKQVVRCA